MRTAALVVLAFIALGLMHSAAYNAREAHRHIHEIACQVGADDLCEFHKGE